MKTTTDPVTWREAARQLREEAALLRASISHEANDAAWHLESMARRFENEAMAAEQAKEESDG